MFGSCDRVHSATPSLSEEGWESESSEIETVCVKKKTHIPFINGSRLSQKFRDYLEMLKSNIHPEVFLDKDWNDPKQKEKPTITAIDSKDITQVWNEVNEVARKRRYSRTDSWMRTYYYLCGLVLKAKISCLKNVEKIGTPGISSQVITYAKRMLKFQYFIVMEMNALYREKIESTNKHVNHGPKYSKVGVEQERKQRRVVRQVIITQR